MLGRDLAGARIRGDGEKRRRGKMGGRGDAELSDRGCNEREGQNILMKGFVLFGEVRAGTPAIQKRRRS